MILPCILPTLYAGKCGFLLELLGVGLEAGRVVGHQFPLRRTGFIDKIAAWGKEIGLAIEFPRSRHSEESIGIIIGEPLAGKEGEMIALGQRRRRDGNFFVAQVRYINSAGRVEAHQDRTQNEGRAEGANQDGDLLTLGGGADQIAGFEVLGGSSGVAGRDSDHSADRKSCHVVSGGGPADDEEDQAGQNQSGNGHSRNGVGRRANFTGDAGADGTEKETENNQEQCAQEVHFEGRGSGDGCYQHDDTDQNELERQVLIRAASLGTATDGAADHPQAGADAAPNDRH